MYGNREKAFLETEAGELREVLVEIRAMADRHLTSEQSRRIAESLAPFKGQTVTFLEYGNSDEAMTFSREVQEVLTQAEWYTRVDGSLDRRNLKGCLFGYLRTRPSHQQPKRCSYH